MHQSTSSHIPSPALVGSSNSDIKFGLHPNERRVLAANLGLSLEGFDQLLASANSAYETLKELGPFYGQEDIIEPTFRIAAESVSLPKGSREKFALFGEDILYVGKALNKLPKDILKKLGDNLDLRLPPTWRIDSIISEDGSVVINEVEGADGASALMIAEQLSYGLQNFNDSTAAHLSKVLKAFCGRSEEEQCRIGIIWPNIEGDPYIPNLRKLSKFVFDISRGKIKIKILDEQEIRAKKATPKWHKYHGIINESFFTMNELKRMGLSEAQVFSSGFYNTIVNKGLFALIFDKTLEDFWIKELGGERLERLQSILIPTYFIETQEDLEKARKMGKVVKVSWASKADMILMDRSKGVAVPDGETKHNTNERWDFLSDFLKKGVRMIAQDYIRPAQINAFLRKKGTNLEKVSWHNRVCIKYVCQGNPNIEEPKVNITAVEVTLGENVVPAGRGCAFTAGKFVD